MAELSLFNMLVWCWIGVGALVAPYLLLSAAPYGRHARRGWGPVLEPRAGWVLMESPALVLLPAFFLTGGGHTAAGAVFAVMWSVHYVNRTLIFPFRMRPGAGMPLLIAGSGFFFNAVNGCIQGWYLFRLAPPYPVSWLHDPRFIAGAALFAAGFILNLQSDAVLRRLRLPGETGYRVPYGGLYRWVSSPNYLCEMIEWAGWAIATWSLSGLAFSLWTAANLLPRALKHHAWYRSTFADYPAERKAVIPLVL